MDDFFSPEGPDSTSDFLAREKAALGGEFNSTSQHSFDQDFASSASAYPDLDATGEDDDLNSFVSAAPVVPKPVLGSSNSNVGVSVTNEDDEFESFENQYPSVELPSASVQQQHNGFGSEASTGAYTQPAGLFQGTPQPTDEDSEFIKSWKVKQAEDIAKREEESSRKKEETIVKAQNAIDNFYKEYNSKKEKNIAINKEEEAAFNTKRTDALAQGTTWERICSIVELEDSRSKTTTQSKKDLSRFKEILLALKREGDSAPGAGGY